MAEGRVGRKSRGTDGSLLPTLPWTLVTLVFALLPHLEFLPPWVSAAFLGCAAWRLVIERQRRSLPSGWLRGLLALLCFLGVLATYDTISGVGPGSALLAVMAALKLLETRRRRDQFVLLFIAIFLVMSALLRDQYLWSVPYLGIAVLLIMTAWLRMSARPSQSIAATVRTSGRLVAYALPLALVMWVFFPRIATPFWSVPIDTGSATSGISDEMRPGDISALSLSDAVAFRARFDAQVPEPRELYWRGLVLTWFNGRTWSAGEPLFGRGGGEGISVYGEPYRYRVWMEPTRQQWVFALDLPMEWTLPQTDMGLQQQLARVYPIDQRIQYDAVSYVRRTVEPVLPQATLDRLYRRLPGGANPRTLALARDMRHEAGSDDAFITAVLEMFAREEFHYTLRPPVLGSNAVDRFLFDTRQGFCEHYASAFAVLMRAAGIPARIVVGYQGGELNPLSNHMIVRQSDAHAWTEVWLDGRGWRRVDPTAAVAPERVDLGVAGARFDGSGRAWGLSAPSALLHRTKLMWDALNATWNEWVLGYGPETQQHFMQWLGLTGAGVREMLLSLLGLVGLLLGALSLVLALRYRPPKPDRAKICYRRFVKKSGVAPVIGETPAAFAARVASSSPRLAGAAHDITAAYLSARYGPTDPNALRNLERLVAVLR